jgi:lipopolysaccharide biosynthesis regulator YciM
MQAAKAAHAADSMLGIHLYSIQQVRAAGLLAQLHVQRGAFDRAAAVHEALALRRSGAGHGEEATLQQRVDSLRDAVLQVPRQPKALDQRPLWIP